MTYAKNQQAILDWVKRERPDVADSIQSIFDNSGESNAQHLWFLMAISFEAGREFQQANPNLPAGPAAYL